MLPILLSLGPVKVYAYGVFVVIGIFLGLYWWWKMGRDEHWDEISLFDSYFLSLLFFGILGRLGYVALHFGDLGTLYRSLAILAFPGMSSVIGIIASTVFLFFFARNQGWDVWKMMDAYVVTLSLILVFGGVGEIFNVPNWLSGGWSILWAFATFIIVSSVRKNFRFYAWYKAEASVVREGLATLIFGMAIGIYYLVAPWLSPSSWKFKMIPGLFFVGLLIVILSGYLIYRRVGRKTSLWQERLQGARINLLQWVRHTRREQ